MKGQHTMSNLDTLIANYQTAAQAVNDLAILWDKPVCGVPHFGHKAARKAVPQKIAAGVKLAQAKHALRQYVQNSKANRERRTKRLQAVQAVIHTFTLE